MARIIQCIPSISEEASGPSYSVVRLCESLIAQRHVIQLATLCERREGRADYIRCFPSSWPRRLGRSGAMRRWLCDAARSGEADVLHNHSLWMMPNVYPSWASSRAGIPLVVSPRGTMSAWAMKSGSALKRVFWPLVQRPAVQVATCFHATATSEYEDIRNAGFRQPVAVIPNGVDIPEDQPRSRAAMRTLLFLGRIHPKKGIDMLLLAWARVEPVFTDWQLRIVGPDNAGYLDAMKRRAAELKLERVRFAGPVYGDRKWDEYRSADLFVLPTHSENFGLAVAEALATGVPAIVTRGAPWADLERQGAGWWIDIGVEPLFAALDNALGRGRADLDAMGQRGRAWISTAFSWSQAARQMGETYEWIVRGGSRPACVRAD